MTTQIFKVLYDFRAEETGEMSISSGDIVKYIPDPNNNDGTNDPKNGWIFVHATKSKESGFVPTDYLEASSNYGSKILSKSQQDSGIKASETKSDNRIESKTISQARYQQSQTQIQTPLKSSSTSDPPPPPPPSTGLTPSATKSDTKLTLANLLPNPKSSLSSSSPDVTTARTTPLSTNSIASILQSSKASTQQVPTSKAGMSSLGVSGVGSIMSASSSKPSMLSKFKSAGKTVQNMVKVTNIVATPRVPSLAAAVEREDFEELSKRNDEYFARLISSQSETFESLIDMMDALSKKLNESSQGSNDLVQRFDELDEMVDEEKRKWQQQIEMEKNAIVINRSKELTQGKHSIIS